MTQQVEEKSNCIILDNGSYSIKGGFSDDIEPRITLPTVIGKSKLNSKSSKYVFGKQALFDNVLSLHRPVKNGIVINWDEMESVWLHAFKNELKIDPSLFGILFCCAPLNPKSNKEKTMEIFFEKFNVKYFGIKDSSLLSLISYGKKTGLVIDSGYESTHIIPIIENNIITNAVTRLKIGGINITHRLFNLLNNRGNSDKFTLNNIPQSDMNTLNDVKHKLCYISLDYNNEIEKELSEKYVLPDGKIMTFKNELFKSPEILFKPSLISSTQAGISKLISNSINLCNKNFNNILYNNIILSGSNTLFEGFVQRLNKELKYINKESNITIHASLTRNDNVFIGGQVLSNLTSFKKSSITKKIYNQYGTSIIHRC